MFSISKIILLLGMCTVISTLTFDWITFSPTSGDTDTIADHSKLGLNTYEADGIQVNYVCGEFTFKEDFDESFKVHYILQKMDEDNSLNKTSSVCDFVKDFIRNYFRPLARYHNDFPRREGVCPIEEGPYHIWPVKNLSQLDAPSKLEPAVYFTSITYLKDGSKIGGFEGSFTAKKLVDP